MGTDGAFNAMYHLDGCTPAAEINEPNAFLDEYNWMIFATTFWRCMACLVAGGQRGCTEDLVATALRFLESRFPLAICDSSRTFFYIDVHVVLHGDGRLDTFPALDQI
eukprot:363189-Chlamydomonas_euryale.AAC.3